MKIDALRDIRFMTFHTDNEFMYGTVDDDFIFFSSIQYVGRAAIAVSEI